MFPFFGRLKKLRKRTWVFIGIGLIIIIIILSNLLNPNRNAKFVTVESVKQGNIIQTVSGPGIVKAKNQVEISAYVLSKVVEIPVKEGQEVKKGDLLVRLDDTKYREEVVRVRAMLAGAQASLDIAERQLLEGRDVFNRQKALYEDGLISKADYDRALTSYRALETAYNQAMSNLTQTRAMLIASEDDLSKTRYTSPIDGVVTKINIEVGEVVVTGTMNTPGTVMVVVSNMNVMEVDAEIDETDVVKIALGQKAQIELDAFPGKIFTGEVIEIGKMPVSGITTSSTTTSSTDSTSQLSADYDVTVTLEGATVEILPGMNATVDIVTSTSENVLYVPIQAIIKRTKDGKIEEGKQQKRLNYVDGVFLLEGKRAIFRQVETGISDDQYIEIKSGLKKGENVITGPYKLLRTLQSGDKVVVRKEGGFEGREK
ncbi:MAG: efflux RND transporter periplasmic adaptor subunit [bacterium]